MRRLFLGLAAAGFAGAAHADIPTINATCPGGIELHVDAGGYAYINGTAAETKFYDANTFDAKVGRTTVSVMMNPDGTANVMYTAAGGANGICEAKVDNG